MLCARTGACDGGVLRVIVPEVYKVRGSALQLVSAQWELKKSMSEKGIAMVTQNCRGVDIFSQCVR